MNYSIKSLETQVPRRLELAPPCVHDLYVPAADPLSFYLSCLTCHISLMPTMEVRANLYNGAVTGHS